MHKPDTSSARGSGRAKLKHLLYLYQRTPFAVTGNLYFHYSNAVFDIRDMANVVSDEPLLVVLAVALPAVYGGGALEPLEL